MRIYWFSRHSLSPAQQQAIQDIHGNVEIIHDSAPFASVEEFVERIRSASQEGFIYCVGGAQHYLSAAVQNIPFGIFENCPQKRQDGQFGLSAVWHYNRGNFEWSEFQTVQRNTFTKVWENLNPEQDQGEALIPVQR